MDFSKVKEAIINDYKKHYLNSHCLLSSLNAFPPELNTVILNFEFNEIKEHLANMKWDERIYFGIHYLMAANIKHTNNEAFGFDKDSYLGIFVDEILVDLKYGIVMVRGENAESLNQFKEMLEKKYNVDTLIKHYDAIPINEITALKQQMKEIKDIDKMMGFMQNHINHFLKTDKKYLDLII